MAEREMNLNINDMNLVTLLCERAEQQPEKRAYTYLADGESEEIHLTYGQLEQQARMIGALLQSEGATGERALLVYPPGQAYIAAFMGCLFAGVVAVPAYPPDPSRLNRTLPSLQAIVADSQARIVLTTSPILMMAEVLFGQAPDLKALRWLATDALHSELAEAWQMPQLSGETLAFLQYTSGSTAAPKGVMLTHANLYHNLGEIHRCFGHSPASVGVIWLPPYHDMGLIGGILQPLYGGFPVVLMSPLDFLKRPFRWLQAVSRYQATTSGGPNFAYDLCVRKITAEQRATLDLSHWAVAFNGAEPVRHETMQRFAKTFAACGFRHEAFYPCYGLAEATLIAAGGSKAAAPVLQMVDGKALEQHEVKSAIADDPHAQTFVSCGRALNEQRLVIVDPQTGHPCSSEKVGEIWLAGPSVTQGYWNQPETTANIYQAYLADGQGPFLRTGDLGFLRDGDLFVTGRIKDMIIVRGRNYYPQDIEHAATQSHPLLRPGCGAAFAVPIDGEDRVIYVHEIKGETDQVTTSHIVKAIRQAVTVEYQLQIYEVVLIRPSTIPKTSSGKIRRQATRTAFLAGELSVIVDDSLPAVEAAPVSVPSEASFIQKALAAMTDASTRRVLLEIYLQEQVAQALGVSPTQVDTRSPLNALGLDSLTAVSLEHEIETALAVVLPDIFLLQGTDITQLAERILAELSGTPTSVPLAQLTAASPSTHNYPLAHGQRSIWFLHQLAPESAAYNIACVANVLSPLDAAALRRALQNLVRRHPMLRTNFLALDGEPFQCINEEIEIPLHLEDASQWSEAFLHEHLTTIAHQPFDIKQAPLFRVHVFKQADQTHILLLVVHHLVADFWSLALFVKELSALYQAEYANETISLSPTLLQYTDYIRWQNDLLDSAEGAQLWAYWQQQLSGDLPVLNILGDRPRPAVQTYRGATKIIKLSVDLTQKLEALSRTYGATLYMTLLAVYQILLHRYTGQEDILVGSPVAGRSRAALSGLIGYFVNPVVLRANLTNNPPFEQLLEQVRQTVLDAVAHQAYPFGLLVERLHPDRDASRTPIFQTMFIFQKSPLPEISELTAFALNEAGVRLDVNGLILETAALENQSAQFDITLIAADLADGLRVACQYNCDLFTETYIDQFLHHYQQLLEQIIAQPTQTLLTLPLLASWERHQLLQEWNDTDMHHVGPECLHWVFVRQATQTPDAVAVVFADHYMTYGELNRRAQHLAIYLQKLGVGPETVVGICLDRSLEMFIGLLGVLMAGAAYLPLDPVYPQERLNFILEDANAPLLLTTQFLQTHFSAYKGQVICLDSAWADDLMQVDGKINQTVNADNLAYMIYTSGSTGKPKGVQVTHRALLNFMHAMQAQPGLTAQDIMLSVTTLSFDIAGLELFLPLLVGATTVLAQTMDTVDGVRLAAELRRCEATILQATPATWQLLLESEWAGDDRLTMLCGGEALSRQLANELAVRGSALWNMYGPTETTIWSAAYRVTEKEGPVFIGQPIANTQIYLLDKNLNPVPVGVPGELYIGGTGLARGYNGRPALTAEKFIPHPFSSVPGARLYRTGDVACYRTNARIEFLGRVDHQVKVRGFRIELAEIETALRRETAVQDVVVLARDDAMGNKRLVAYIIPADPHAKPTANDLRHALQAELPDYMIPSLFLTLESFPLTPNGKINRRALPTPTRSLFESETAFVKPETELEQKIAEIWQNVLQVDRVGAHDHFFELGGHSLLMVKIQNQLQIALSMSDLSIVELFQYPTVHSFAKYLSQKSTTPEFSSSSQQRIETRHDRQNLLQQQRQRRQQTRMTDQ